MNSSLLLLLLHRGDAGTVSPGGAAASTSGQQAAARGKGKEPRRRHLGGHRPHLKVDCGSGAGCVPETRKGNDKEEIQED